MILIDQKKLFYFVISVIIFSFIFSVLHYYNIIPNQTPYFILNLLFAYFSVFLFWFCLIRYIGYPKASYFNKIVPLTEENFYKQNSEKVIELYNLILENNKNNHTIWNWLCNIYLVKQEFDKVISTAIEGLLVNPKANYLWYQLSVAYYLSGNEKLARYAFKNTINFIQIEPFSDIDLLKTKQTLINAYIINENFDAAEKLSLELIAYNPNEKFSWAILGKVYLGKNNYEKAIETIEKALKIDSNYVRALTYLAQVYNKLENFELEKNLYNKIIFLGGIDPDAWNFLGWVYYEKGDYGKTIEYSNFALTLNPTNEFAWSNLDRIYLKSKDSIGTFPNIDLSFVKTLKRVQSSSYFRLAKFLFTINKYNEALQACEKVFDYKPYKKSALKLKEKLIATKT